MSGFSQGGLERNVRAANIAPAVTIAQVQVKERRLSFRVYPKAHKVHDRYLDGAGCNSAIAEAQVQP